MTSMFSKTILELPVHGLTRFLRSQSIRANSIYLRYQQYTNMSRGSFLHSQQSRYLQGKRRELVPLVEKLRLRRMQAESIQLRWNRLRNLAQQPLFFVVDDRLNFHQMRSTMLRLQLQRRRQQPQRKPLGNPLGQELFFLRMFLRPATCTEG